MKIRLCRNKCTQKRKGKYIDKEIAKQLVEIGRGKRAFKEEKYAKALQYLEKKALNPKATDRIKFIVGASYTEIKIHEKEATELLKSIIQKYKDEPKDNRPFVYSGAILEYAKIQLRNELTEFAIYLLEDIAIKNEKYNIEALVELAKAYDMQTQTLRSKAKNEEALETEKKVEEICLKCKELLENNKKLTKKAAEVSNLLGILYIRQGKIEKAEKEFQKLEGNGLNLLKRTYFKEESEEEVNKRIERLEKKLEAIENGEEEEKKEYARELNLVSRLEYFEELSPDLNISNGIDIFTGYKMYEYKEKGICVIDKVFSEMKDGKKILGATYIFPKDITFEISKLSRTEITNLLETNSSIQKQEHKGDYYNCVQEKMKRAELEGLVIEEKKLKAKEQEIEKLTREKKEQENKEGEQ